MSKEGFMHVSENEIDQKGKRDALKVKRDRLFERLSKNPMNISLAAEIKLIDDQIAECVQQMQRSNAAQR
jgi:hypothetical protein